MSAIREALPPDVSLREVISQTTADDLFVFEHGFRPSAPQAAHLLTSMFQRRAAVRGRAALWGPAALPGEV